MATPFVHHAQAAKYSDGEEYDGHEDTANVEFVSEKSYSTGRTVSQDKHGLLLRLCRDISRGRCNGNDSLATTIPSLLSLVVYSLRVIRWGWHWLVGIPSSLRCWWTTGCLTCCWRCRILLMDFRIEECGRLFIFRCYVRGRSGTWLLTHSYFPNSNLQNFKKKLPSLLKSWHLF